MDFENSLMLWCIIYRLDQVVGDVLSQNSIPRKGFIKYNTKNEITPMKTLVDCAHLRLVAHRKLVITISIVEANHSH
jgi:hypothetical protein